MFRRGLFLAIIIAEKGKDGKDKKGDKDKDKKGGDSEYSPLFIKVNGYTFCTEINESPHGTTWQNH